MSNFYLFRHAKTKNKTDLALESKMGREAIG